MDEYIKKKIGDGQKLIETRIFIKKRDFKYIYCNDIFAADLCMEKEDILGKDDFFLYPAGIAEKYKYDDGKVFQYGKFHDCHEMYMLSGKMYWANTAKIPIFDQDGNVTGVLGLVSVAVKTHSRTEESSSVQISNQYEGFSKGEFRKHFTEEDLKEIMHFSSFNQTEQNRTISGIVDAVHFYEAV